MDNSWHIEQERLENQDYEALMAELSETVVDEEETVVDEEGVLDEEEAEIDEDTDTDTDTETENTCPVCRVVEMDINNVVNTECGHKFCKNCFFTWVQMKRTCPLCRYDMVATDNLTNNDIEFFEKLEYKRFESAERNTMNMENEERKIRRDLRYIKSKHKSLKNELNMLYKSQKSFRDMIEHTRGNLLGQYLRYIRINNPKYKFNKKLVSNLAFGPHHEGMKDGYIIADNDINEMLANGLNFNKNNGILKFKFNSTNTKRRLINNNILREKERSNKKFRKIYKRERVLESEDDDLSSFMDIEEKEEDEGTLIESKEDEI